MIKSKWIMIGIVTTAVCLKMICFPESVLAQDIAWQEYFPRADKTSGRWEYRMAVPKIFGGVDTYKMVGRITGEEKHDGKTYKRYVVVIEGIPGTDAEVSLVRISKDGLFGWTEETGDIALFSFPMKMGDKKKLSENSTITFVGRGSIDLLEKSFEDCITLETNQTDPETKTKTKSTDYYARGVGLVKSIITMKKEVRWPQSESESETTISFELIDYSFE